MNAFATVFYDWSRSFARYFTWAAPLAVRIVVGWVFADTGWIKLTHLPQIIENFRNMHLPAPELLTPFVSGVEFVGGLMILFGLLTRFAAVPLMAVMLVAIVVAKASEIDSIVTLLGFEEVSYFVMFAWLAIAGPGPISLDHYVLKASGRDPAAHGA